MEKTLDKLEITKVKSDETETIDLDHLFVNYGSNLLSVTLKTGV